MRGNSERRTGRGRSGSAKAKLLLLVSTIGCHACSSAESPASVELDASDDGAADVAAEATVDAPTDTAVDAPGGCGAISSWADTAVFKRDLHVKAGAAAGGDGSSGKPFATIAAGLSTAKPGDRVVVHAGTYPGGIYADKLQGTASEPIALVGAVGEARPQIVGADEGLHLTDPTWLLLQDLEIRGQTGNAMNVDDGGSYATPAHHVVFRRLFLHDVATGNHDGLKLSGVDDALVVDSTFQKIGGQMIDMVGCHRVTVARSTFRDGESVGVQMKGGSADDVVTQSLFVNAGPRGVNLGGSTDLPYFRPSDAPHEAARIVVTANVVVGGDAPVAFVGCDACTVSNNTLLRPNKWAARILQETVASRFVPCRKGRFTNNLVVVGPGISGETVNVGPDTDAGSFTFANNLWFHTGNPSFAPTLPVTETGGIRGKDPLLVDSTKPDAHLGAASPAIGKGLAPTTLPTDFEGKCWKTPPSIGAFEVP